MVSLSGCSRDVKPLELAQQNCDADKHGTQLLDHGNTLIIKAVDPSKSSLTILELGCTLNELKSSAAVVSHIETTRAIDGRQTDSWGNYKAAWSYHPDQGLDLVIQENSEVA